MVDALMVSSMLRRGWCDTAFEAVRPKKRRRERSDGTVYEICHPTEYFTIREMVINKTRKESLALSTAAFRGQAHHGGQGYYWRNSAEGTGKWQCAALLRVRMDTQMAWQWLWLRRCLMIDDGEKRTQKSG